MNASKQQGHDLHAELHAELEVDPNYQARYHKSCVTKYLTKAKRSSGKKTSLDPSPLPQKRALSNIGPHPFEWLRPCLYCSGSCDLSGDPKHPNQWKPVYLVRETERKPNDDGIETTIEGRIKEKCFERGDDWSTDVLEHLADLTVKSADLHAAGTRLPRRMLQTVLWW